MEVAPLLELVERYCVQGAPQPYASDVAQRTHDFLSTHQDDFWKRSAAAPGHITASAWVVNPEHTHILFTHHRSLDDWFQLGGHIEAEDADIYAAVLREVKEECGLVATFLSREIFDIDIHDIPARPARNEGAHVHFDIRFVLEAPFIPPTLEHDGSLEIVWVPIERIEEKTTRPSVTRPVALVKRLQ